jgi:hypothetical protein
MSLYDALIHWSRSNELPKGFDLPTKRQMIDRQLSKLTKVALEHTPRQREALRLQQAARRRAAKAKS